jgi:3-hydroxyacyl-[acyl-carrier-protein] dehydratase
MDGHAEWEVALDHPAVAGHFPGNPIVPGAVLLQEIVAAIAGEYPGMMCRTIDAAKFLHPVRPGAMLAIDWEDGQNGDIRFTCTLGPAGPRVATGVLRLGPAERALW